MSNFYKDHRDVLIAPVVSEKSYGLLDANKYTLNRPGKTRRTRFGMGKRADTKRAVVSLAEGDRIDIFGGPVS
jgi:large subunit ribosomal protein L23